jgi:hypothetical protein
MNSSQPSQGAGPDAASTPLVTALRRLLRPLVHLLVARGITFPFLSNLLKQVYVDVAERDFPLDGKPQTVSRISVLSGVHRKDVRRLLDEAEPDATSVKPPRAVSMGARLISTWMDEQRFRDADGHPRALSRGSSAESAAEEATFETLVETVHRGDVRPRVVLDELLRIGVVEVDDKGFISLKTEALVPTGAFDELAYYFGRNLRDHIAASSHNLAGDQPPQPERALYHDRLSQASADQLRDLARSRAMDVLRELNSEAARLSSEDVARGDADQRVTVGFYFWNALDDGDSREGDAPEDSAQEPEASS